ncbi:MAG: 7-cyano-7-deazaguanine synthase QueC [Gammaproteobacteria bacterium]|nr:7-cyano-7-deazaguanine synthase QueC [Gammaproteobacteria bacterium]
MNDNPRAVALVSGGLDSATCLALAKHQGFDCYALSFNYGQRHGAEVEAARRVAAAIGVCRHKVISIDLRQFGGSALTDDAMQIPLTPSENIPVTYVPARNTIFLSYALAWAEVTECYDIFIGVNAVDYSGYPDCRPEYIQAYQAMARLATKAGVEGRPVRIHTPLIYLTKAEIVKKGVELGVDYRLTVSCYQADTQGRACGVCEACRLRAEGFKGAGVADPTIYLGSC